MREQGEPPQGLPKTNTTLRWKGNLRTKAAFFVLLFGGAAIAQENAPPLSTPWPMERVQLVDGRRIEGLVLDTQGPTIDVVDIRRPAGRPTYLMVRPIERAKVVEIERLKPAERDELRARIERFRNRALIEAGRMDDVALTMSIVDGVTQWRYHGEWFDVESFTSEDVTRRCVVRLEQIFLAYRQVLPPRFASDPKRPLRIVIYGSTEQFAQSLRTKGIDLQNAAYFDPEANTIAAGSDVKSFADELAIEERRRNEAIAKQKQLIQNWPRTIEKLQAELEKGGFAGDDRRKIIGAAQLNWEREKSQLADAIRKSDRLNAGLVERLTGQMMRTLYHEAFHAYLENYVYPHNTADIPRWLNEGLAQIFEGGIIEDDALRIDAVPARKLSDLQDDLRSGKPLPLLALVSAAPDSFLVGHRSDAKVSRRHYLYGWGLAYYLTFERNLLDQAMLDTYATKESASLAPRDRLERLVNQPLETFEREWQNYILGLKKPR